MRYDLLLMDADMTVFDFLAGEREAIACALRWAGIDDPGAPEAYSRINAACWRDLEKGLIDHPTLKVRRFRELFALYGCEKDPAEGADRFVAALARQGQLLPGAEEALRELEPLVPMVLVTNGLAAVQRGRFDSSPVRKYFRDLVISSEVGFYKPDPRLIEYALKKQGVPRERALMVGDGLTSDVLGAQRAGVDACWFNPGGLPCTLERAPEYTIRSLREIPGILLGR